MLLCKRRDVLCAVHITKKMKDYLMRKPYPHLGLGSRKLSSVPSRLYSTNCWSAYKTVFHGGVIIPSKPQITEMFFSLQFKSVVVLKTHYSPDCPVSDCKVGCKNS